MNESGPPRKLRLFIAITPPDAVKAALAGAQEQLRRRLPPRSVRWTPAEQIHLTLRFLGDVSEELLSELSLALADAGVGQPGFELTAQGWGVFPALRRPRVVWVGLAGDLAGLERLRQAVSSATARWGLPVEASYRPHLTLGRFREPAPALRAAVGHLLAEVSVGALGKWCVNPVELFQSELRPDGASHTRLGSYALANPAADAQGG